MFLNVSFGGGRACAAMEEWYCRRLKGSLDSKEIKLVNLKGNQPLIFIGRINAEAEAPILWPPSVKCQVIEKDSHTGKVWGQEDDGWMASATQWTRV